MAIAIAGNINPAAPSLVFYRVPYPICYGESANGYTGWTVDFDHGVFCTTVNNRDCYYVGVFRVGASDGNTLSDYFQVLLIPPWFDYNAISILRCINRPLNRAIVIRHE